MSCIRPAVVSLLLFACVVDADEPRATDDARPTDDAGQTDEANLSDEANSSDDAGDVREQLRSELVRLDRNADRQLSRDEFLKRSLPKDVLERDFQLFDFDGDGALSSSEFAAVSGVVAAADRGRIPDPYDELVDHAVAALDQSYDDWHLRPSEQVNAHTFVANFIGSISHGGKRYVTGRILRHADRNSDGRLSRVEARYFLEHQLGVRWYDGPRLREPGGRLVRLDRFIEMDANQDDMISRTEFLARWWNSATANKQFVLNDRNFNGRVTYAEFAHHAAKNFFDPIEWFRKADEDLNALLDLKELIGAVDQSRQHLIACNLAAFDDDHDEMLSFRELQRSMLCSFNYTWDIQPIDVNRNGRLTYDEFVFNEADLFQLQRRYFFHRLDIDESGFLSPDEFEFSAQDPYSIHLRAADGSTSREIYRNDDYPICGWPDVSPDGQRILFHRFPRGRSALRLGQCRIAVMNFDGENVRDLCDGTNPSWSPDGKQFSCVRLTGEKSRVWIMDADGRSGLQLERGHAPRWSPARSEIAYLRDNGIWIYDVETATSRQILERQEHAYQNLGDDIAWSPDGKQLAVLGRLGKESRLLILDVEGRATRELPSFQVSRQTDLNWTRRNGILFSVLVDNGLSLISVSPQAERPAGHNVKGFDAEDMWKSACMTLGEKWYIAISSR